MNDRDSVRRRRGGIPSRSLAISALLLVIGVSGFSQTKIPKENKFHLRHHLIFLKETAPRVSPSRIIFTEKSICNFDGSVYDGRILNRDTEIELISIDRENSPARVTFGSADRRFDILVANSSDNEFKRSFDTVFAKKERKVGYPKGIKTWKDVVKYYGFPIAICRTEDRKESWFYIVEFSVEACGSFDGCWVSLSKEGTEVWGYI